MKTITSVLVFAMAMLIINSVSASEADTTKVQKKIVKTIQITDNGKTFVDSTTVYDGDKVEVFVNSGTKKHRMGKMKHRKLNHGTGDDLRWKQGAHKEFDIELEHADGSDSVRMIMFKQRLAEGDMCPHADGMFGPERMGIEHRKGMPFPANQAPMMRQRENLIDLNAPDIISFEKSVDKEGNEKLVIIRKKRE